MGREDPESSTCLVEAVDDEDWQQVNFGALLASSWTKQRFTVLCHTALASAAAIISP